MLRLENATLAAIITLVTFIAVMWLRSACVRRPVR